MVSGEQSYFIGDKKTVLQAEYVIMGQNFLRSHEFVIRSLNKIHQATPWDATLVS